MQHDLMYSGGAGGDRLLMFGSSSSIASIAAAAAAAAAAGEMGAASRPRLKCPRCDSLNTKFCYYNNYNLSQPRHFCKACRRYWTKGGILRNVPIGGASRRSASSAGSSSSASKRSSGASPSPSSSKVLRRHMMYQQDVEPAGGMAYPTAAAWVESPTSSSPDASTFSMNSLDAAPGFFPAPPGLSEESSSGGADLISTSAGVPVSPPHTFSATTVVVDGPSVDDLMMAAELFPFDLGVSGSDPFQITPQAEDVALDVDDLAGTMEFVDQTVPLGVGDRSLEAVVNGCYVEREEVADREADLSLRAPVAPDAGDTAAVTFNYVDNWQDLPHVPLVSDTNIYYDYDLLAFGVSIAGCDGAADVDGQQQQQKQQQELGDDQPQQQLNLWDNSSYYCQHWGGIDIDQSLLDLL